MGIYINVGRHRKCVVMKYKNACYNSGMLLLSTIRSMDFSLLELKD